MDFVNWLEAELNKREARLITAYETTDAYTPQEFALRRKEIQARREELENEQAQMEQARREAETKRDTIRSMRDLLPHLLHWIEHDDPKVVKFHLSRVVRLTAYPDKTIKAEPLD